MEELKQHINAECRRTGINAYLDMLDAENAPGPPRHEPKEQKWHVCQNFAEVNCVTEIAPMPQGNIRLKQQKLSSHHYMSIVAVLGAQASSDIVDTYHM